MSPIMSALDDKGRQTNQDDEILKLVKKKRLSKEDKETLIEYCVAHGIPNIHHVIHDPQSIADVIKGGENEEP